MRARAMCMHACEADGESGESRVRRVKAAPRDEASADGGPLPMHATELSFATAHTYPHTLTPHIRAHLSSGTGVVWALRCCAVWLHFSHADQGLNSILQDEESRSGNRAIEA